MTTAPSLREVFSDLKHEHILEERRGDWATALMFRLPSQFVAWFFLRLGWSPSMVTSVGFLTAVTIPFVALFLPLHLATWAIVILGAFFQMCDCADGTMARISGKSSILGADFDFLVDMFYYACLYISIGLIADRVLDTGYFWALMGAIALSARYFARLVREQTKKHIGENKPGPIKLRDVPTAFIAGLSGLIPFGVFAGPYISWVVIALIVYSVLDIIDALKPMRNPPYRD